MSPAPAKAAAPAHRPAVTRSAPPAPGPIRTRARPVGLGNTVSLAMAQRAPGGAAPGAGNAAMVQAHRTVPVSAHDDPAEREAERVARRVVETMQSTLVVTEAPRVIARLPTGAPPFGAPSEAGMTAASSGGTPLPPGTRRFMESRFDADFGDIRVHEDERAAKLADGMGARAFAYGKHLFFARGQYRPDSADGAELIAHELTHTIQQGAAPQHAAPAQPQAPRVQRANVLGFELTLSPLDWAAKQANLLPGFPLLTLILGLNPINGAKVDRSPANLIRAVITLMPGGALIVQALDRYGIIDKVGGWISAQIDTLKLAGAAIAGAFTAALKSIDLTDPSGSWERVKRIFTEPIDRIKQFIHGLVDGVIQFVRDAVLRPLVGLAAKTKGWDLLIAVLGRNPITGEPVPQTADTLVGGFMKLIGQEEIWENIKKANAIARVMAWYQKSKAELLNFVQQFPTLFLHTLKSFKIEDLLDLTAAFGRVAASFGDFAGRFFTWAGAAMWSILEIVFEVVSPAALGYIKKAGAAFKDILKNPLGFVGNLVKAAKLGLTNFADNLVEHLKAGLIDWLTGSLPGVYIPKALSLGELGKFALSVLGISWGQVRGKIVKALGAAGETIMKGLETTYDVVIALVNGGAAAVWELIKEKLTDLKDTVLQGIIGFVVDAVVKKAIPKLVAMFIPGAGFISAIISIYDTIMVFVEKLSKIAAAVKAFVDSIIAIAQGQIGGAAKKVESTLAGLLSLAISFLAGFAGLGKVADKIKEVIQKVWATVDKAVETAVGWIVGKAKALFGKLFGKGDKKDERTDEQKKADLDKGIAEADAIFAKEDSTPQEVAKQLPVIQKKYKLASLTLVKEADDESFETDHIEGTVNPGSKSPPRRKKKSRGVVSVSVTSTKPPGLSTVGALPVPTDPKSWGGDPTDPDQENSRGSWRVYEHLVGAAIETAAGVKVSKGGLPARADIPQQPGQAILLSQALLGLPADKKAIKNEDPRNRKKPDYVLLRGGVVEVFEATLDVRFDKRRTGSGTVESSHKVQQITYDLEALQRLYPGVPIIYSLVTPEPITDEIREAINKVLKGTRANVQVNWRS